MEADFITQIFLPVALFIIMLGMGLSLRVQDFIDVLNQPKALFVGLCAQLILLPFLAVIVIGIVGLDAELAVGLFIIALSPGGSTSNMFTYLAKGDLALSISLTSVVSLITPFSLPVLTTLAIHYYMGDSQTIELPLIKTIVQLIVITVIPVAIGMILLRKAPKISAKAEQPIKIMSIAFLAIIILGIIVKNRASMFGFFIETGLAAVLLNISAMTLGYLIGSIARLSKPQSITLGFEVGIQNGTVALLVSGTLLSNAIMSIPAITYSLLMFATAGAFGWLLSGK